ncbi:MAG: NADH-ubiquinone oxidoreductase-F iron-sulfur binding region domain-containing protein [Nocardioides sp.]
MTTSAFPGLGYGGRQELLVRPGPVLLRGVRDGPALDAHRRQHGSPARPSVDELIRLTESSGLRGRGGAGFPFARKLAVVAAGHGRATVVVNLSEGEPASFKDAALALTSPHLVLDGAAATARALGVRTVQLVLPGDEVPVADAIRRAVAERRAEDSGTRWRLHLAGPRFVAGQARAVIELLSGRENLPVTAWQPEAMRGYRNRPTLLSNAETFAQVGALLTTGEGAGTTLLTLRGDTSAPHVVEVAHGTPWTEVLGTDVEGPVLLGGFHGVWARPGVLAGLRVDRDELAGQGLTLGAGVVLPLPSGTCPLHRTAAIVDYLADQSAGRCGPCLNGLPELARTVHELDRGRPSQARAEQLVGLVTRRGACAHPDGTARLVSSMLAAFPDEPHVHATGRCSFAAARPVTPRSLDLAGARR